MGAFTGTWDNSVNNNNITLSATGSSFNNSGSGTRTVRLGTATYTLTNNAASWNMTTTTNLTFVGSSANIVFSGGSGNHSFIAGASQSHGNLTFGAHSGAGFYTITGTTPTFASLSITAPNFLVLPLTTITISGAFTWTGSSSNPIGVTSTTPGSNTTIAAAGGSTAAFTAIRDVTFTGSPTASNSFDLGGNSGIAISGPSSGVAAASVIGS